MSRRPDTSKIRSRAPIRGADPYRDPTGADAGIVTFVGRAARFGSAGMDEPSVFFRDRYHGVSTGDAPEWPLPIHHGSTEPTEGEHEDGT